MFRPGRVTSAIALSVLLLSSACAPSKPDAERSTDYGGDRALIEDLQARYLFAMDFRDSQAYAATFAEDGILDFGAGRIQGREEIRGMLEGIRERAIREPGRGAPKGRHSITTMVIDVNGERATAAAYWFLMVNDNPERKAQVHSFGHYEDELVKIDGKWLFSLRKIYNEGVPAWSWTTDANPAESPGAGPGRGAPSTERVVPAP